MMDKVVLAGGQCSGKTSVLDEFQLRGYSVIPETALYLIRREAKRQNLCFPWTNHEEFQKRVLETQRRREFGYSERQGVLILDRCALDSIAYQLADRHPLPALRRINLDYPLVFFLEMLPEHPFWHHCNKPRKTTYEEAVRRHSILKEIYTQCHPRVIPIPYNGMSPAQRTDLIEKHLLENRIISLQYLHIQRSFPNPLSHRQKYNT